MAVPPQLHDQLVAWRRCFHKFAKVGWTQILTTPAIIAVFRDLGWCTVYGPELHDADTRLGVPSAEVLTLERERAVAQGANPELVEAMGTGSPVSSVYWRQDDPDRSCASVSTSTATTWSNWPMTAIAFALVNHGAMHGRGHDGQAAIGLGLATMLFVAQQGGVRDSG